MQPELLFVGQLPGARLFLQHDHYNDTEVRNNVLNKVCKCTCNCNRPQVHRFAPLNNALLKVLWTMLWTHSLESGVWRGLNVVNMGFICKIPHLRRPGLKPVLVWYTSECMVLITNIYLLVSKNLPICIKNSNTNQILIFGVYLKVRESLHT